MTENGTEAAAKLKAEGNQAFQADDMDTALDCYTRAIDILPGDQEKELAVLFKNRAAVHLKREDFQLAVDDCTQSLELVPDDPKALFRRCQAYEALNQVDLGYKDAREVHRLDANNKAIQPILTRLHKAFSDKLNEISCLGNKVSSMFEIVFDPSQDQDKREKGADNLIVLARERSGAEALFKEGAVPKIAKLMKIEKNTKIRLSCIRTISEICKKSEEYTKSVLTACGIPFFLDVLNTHDSETVTAASHMIQVILNSLSMSDMYERCKQIRAKGRNMTSEERKWMLKNEDKRRQHIAESKEMVSIFNVLMHNITSRRLTGEARDALVELIMKNCKYTELNWAEMMLKTDAYQRLMEVASEMTEYKYESSMEVTDESRTIVGVTLAYCYEAMYDDKRRNLCLELIDKFTSEKLMEQTTESRVRCVVAITALLKNAVEIGQAQIAKEGVVSLMIQMAQSEDYLQQLAASEALIAAAQKKKDSNVIIQQGLDILKELYRSKNDHIKVRALVGMCKLGASAGHDASMRPFADGSVEKLAEACRRFLINPGKDRDLRKWAAEGLSYLTLDATVKEKLCDDEAAIRALIDLAMQGKNQDCQYGIMALLVNLTNSYEKEEIVPEMIELAKFAKHHIPEEHELDDRDFIDKRIFTLAHYGVTSALVALSKTESKNIRELISRVLNAICLHSELRGLVVQQGGSKALVTMALDGTDKGTRHAAQALARIGITQDPAIAFPGQRSVDVIRPICRLLNTECGGLENFEALMALCNLATLNESTRARLLKESEFVTQIENYMFEDHEMIRRAAVQCFTNLCQSPLMVQRCEKKNDKVKYLVLLCGDDADVEVVRAAAGGLAMLTSQSEKICRKIFESVQWNECLLNTLANPNIDIVLRGTVIVKNMIAAGKDVAEKVIETEIPDCLQAHIFKAQLDQGSAKPDESLQKIKVLAEEALKTAHQMKLVKTKEEAEKDRNSDED